MYVIVAFCVRSLLKPKEKILFNEEAPVPEHDLLYNI